MKTLPQNGRHAGKGNYAARLDRRVADPSRSKPVLRCGDVDLNESMASAMGVKRHVRSADAEMRRQAVGMIRWDQRILRATGDQDAFSFKRSRCGG